MTSDIPAPASPDALRLRLRELEAEIDKHGYGRAEIRAFQDERREIFARLRADNTALRTTHRSLILPAFPGTLVSFQESVDHGFIYTLRSDTPGPNGYKGPQVMAVEYGVDIPAMAERAYALLLRYVKDAERRLAIAYGKAEEARAAAQPKSRTPPVALDDLLGELGL